MSHAWKIGAVYFIVDDFIPIGVHYLLCAFILGPCVDASYVGRLKGPLILVEGVVSIIVFRLVFIFCLFIFIFLSCFLQAFVLFIDIILFICIIHVGI